MINSRSYLALIFTLASTFIGCAGFQTREALKEQEQKREIVEKVSTLQKSNADVNSRFSDLEGEIREVRGKIEVAENRIGLENANHDKSKKALEEQIIEANKKIALLQEEIGKIREQLTSISTDLASNKTEKVEKSDGSAFTSAEALYEKKEWKKAILSYQKFRDAKPKDKKVPESIYKIGVCFQELTMKDEAKAFYEELIAKYPNSGEAKKAKSRLKKLK